MSSTSKPEASPGPPGRAWLLPVVVTAVVIALLVFVLRDIGGPSPDTDRSANDLAPIPSEQGPADEPSDDERAAARSLERRDPDDVLAAGPVDAPITLVVFSDFQCPFCAAWSHQTLPTMRTYVDSGDLRIEWRDVNIMSDVSAHAAAASYAAGLQDHYWEYHELLFPGGNIRPESDLSEDGLVALAEELGLDPVRFRADMTSSETLAIVDRNAQEGRAAGVFSTPAFVLDGTPLLGAQPTEVFVEAVEDALQVGG